MIFSIAPSGVISESELKLVNLHSEVNLMTGVLQQRKIKLTILSATSEMSPLKIVSRLTGSHIFTNKHKISSPMLVAGFHNEWGWSASFVSQMCLN